MQLVEISTITIPPNRQRKEFDETAIAELGASIQAPHGLLHPLVVRPNPAGGWFLVAGERRLRAIIDIHELNGAFTCNGQAVPPGKAPVVQLAQLSDLEYEEAELEENIRRVDLSWQERAQATARLMSLRERQADAAGKPGPTVAAIAEEVRGSSIGDAQTSTRNEIIVARHLADPDVAKAASVKEAMKILKKKEEVKKAGELAAVVGQTFSTDAHRLLNVDCLEWMRNATAEQFDIILSDPPYGMGADQFGDSGQSAEAHFYDDSYGAWVKLFCDGRVPYELFRLAKPQAHAYLFCDFDRFHELAELMRSVGWKVHRTPLIWHNTDGFRAPWPEMGPQRRYELILYAVKGDRKTARLAPDVFTCGKDPSVGHPAQKPVPLLEDLLRRSALPGNTVFDPFAGSGSTIVACHELKLSCTALEKDSAAYGVAVKRLQALKAFEEALF